VVLANRNRESGLKLSFRLGVKGCHRPLRQAHSHGPGLDSELAPSIQVTTVAPVFKYPGPADSDMDQYPRAGPYNDLNPSQAESRSPDAAAAAYLTLDSW
jgi:hypothetical protein